MKTLMIERVTNGWIIRPVQMCPSWNSDDLHEMYVYKTVEDIQSDLPALLGVESENIKERYFTNTESGGWTKIKGQLSLEQQGYVNSGLWRQVTKGEAEAISLGEAIKAK